MIDSRGAGGDMTGVHGGKLCMTSSTALCTTASPVLYDAGGSRAACHLHAPAVKEAVR